MACDRFTGAVRASALGSPLAADAAAHLAVCPACQATLAAEARVLATIDVALGEVASTAPSAHFVSRLRAHVEQAPPRWTPAAWWMPAAAAALALLIAAAAVVRMPRERADRRTAPAGADVPLAAAAANAVEPSLAPAPETARRPLAIRRTAPSPSRTAQTPEVLVPGREREAVGRLFASLRAGRPEVVSMLMNLHGGDAVSDASGVTIEPLRIDPVVVPAMPASAFVIDR
jgi:hypothetical protein